MHADMVRPAGHARRGSTSRPRGTCNHRVPRSRRLRGRLARRDASAGEGGSRVSDHREPAGQPGPSRPAVSQRRARRRRDGRSRLPAAAAAVGGAAPSAGHAGRWFRHRRRPVLGPARHRHRLTWRPAAGRGPRVLRRFLLRHPLRRRAVHRGQRRAPRDHTALSRLTSGPAGDDRPLLGDWPGRATWPGPSLWATPFTWACTTRPT